MDVCYHLHFNDIENFQNVDYSLACRGDIQAVSQAAELIETYANLWGSNYIIGVGEVDKKDKDSNSQDFWIEWDNGNQSFGYICE